MRTNFSMSRPQHQGQMAKDAQRCHVSQSNVVLSIYMHFLKIYNLRIDPDKVSKVKVTGIGRHDLGLGSNLITLVAEHFKYHSEKIMS